jgi:hypothetical protein
MGVTTTYAGDQMSSHDSEATLLSARCALVMKVAIDDYHAWFTGRHDDADFVDNFRSRFGTINCIDVAGGVRIHILPKKEGVRGGGILYLIDREGRSVLERTFER